MPCFNRAALIVSTISAGLGITWILVSDRVAAAIAPDHQTLLTIQEYKGVAFILLMSAVVYVLVCLHARRMDAEHQAREDAYDQTLSGWAAALDLRDHSTAEHTQRVTALTEQLAARLGFRGTDLVNVRRGALLHDIGKMGVPDSVLSKPGALDEAEWTQMRRHPELAVGFLQGIDYLRDALDIPWCHHERFDGTGYPRGLAGEDIPLAARAFAVVDVYDAVTSERPYRSPLTKNEALALIRAGAGTQFDPRVVSEFEWVVDRQPARRLRAVRSPSV